MVRGRDIVAVLADTMTKAMRLDNATHCGKTIVAASMRVICEAVHS